MYMYIVALESNVIQGEEGKGFERNEGARHIPRSPAIGIQLGFTLNSYT
jgi:hypothetical protein